MKLLRRLIMVLAAAALIAGSGAAGYYIFTGDLRSNRESIFRYLTGKLELPASAACGILANIDDESGFDPLAEGDGKTSFGICQWHAARFDQLMFFCGSRGLDYTTLEGQLEYLNYELTQDFSGMYRELKELGNDGDSAYEAGYQWCFYYERPVGYKEIAVNRGELARTKYWPLYGDK